MNFVLTGDWHLSDHLPRFRTDPNYLATAMGKVGFLLKLAQDVEPSKPTILQPGDFWDSARASYETVRQTLSKLAGWPGEIITTLGQHDTHFHHLSLQNTPMGVLRAALPATVSVFADPTAGACEWVPCRGVNLLVLPWGACLPEPDELKITQKGTRHVILTHRMVTNNGREWAGQEGNLDARTLLEDYPQVDLWVTGDNHKAFTVSVKDRHVVNCGALLRSAIDQTNHRPRAYVWDSANGGLTREWIPCGPSVEVFDRDKAELLTARNERLEAFIANLAEGRTVSTNFKDNLLRCLADLDDPDHARIEHFIMEAMHDGSHPRTGLAQVEAAGAGRGGRPAGC